MGALKEELSEFEKNHYMLEVSLPSNTPQYNVDALEEKVFFWIFWIVCVWALEG